jgi:hypothetical protein
MPFEQYEQKAIHTTDEMLNLWVTQEGNRFREVLIERGFLRQEDAANNDIVSRATHDWRKTYLKGLNLDQASWREYQERDITGILKWLLGGWPGWKSYRPIDAEVTTFENVNAAIDSNNPTIPAHHPKYIPEMAQKNNRDSQKHRHHHADLWN